MWEERLLSCVPILCLPECNWTVSNVTERHCFSAQGFLSARRKGVWVNTRDTQNTPTFGSWGFDSPSRHQPSDRNDTAPNQTECIKRNNPPDDPDQIVRRSCDERTPA